MNPTDPLPFANGWVFTLRASWGLLRPVFPRCLAVFFAAYFSVVLAGGLIDHFGEFDFPPLSRWVCVSVAVGIASAFTARIIFDRFLGQTPALSRVVRSVRANLVSVAGAVSIGTGLIVLLWLWDDSWAPLSVFVLSGLPIVIHGVVLEGLPLERALSRVGQGFSGKGWNSVLAAWVLTMIGVLFRQKAITAAETILQTISERSFLGAMALGALRSLVSSVALAFGSSLWVVAYLNTWSLTDGVDTEDIRRERLVEVNS